MSRAAASWYGSTGYGVRWLSDASQRKAPSLPSGHIDVQSVGPEGILHDHGNVADAQKHAEKAFRKEAKKVADDAVSWLAGPAERLPRKIDQKDYTHYVVRVGASGAWTDDRIESGWSFPEDAREHVRENLTGMRGPWKVYTRKTLVSRGLDPKDNRWWLTAADLHESLPKGGGQQVDWHAVLLALLDAPDPPTNYGLNEHDVRQLAETYDWFGRWVEAGWAPGTTDYASLADMVRAEPADFLADISAYYGDDHYGQRESLPVRNRTAEAAQAVLDANLGANQEFYIDLARRALAGGVHLVDADKLISFAERKGLVQFENRLDWSRAERLPRKGPDGDLVTAMVDKYIKDMGKYHGPGAIARPDAVRLFVENSSFGQRESLRKYVVPNLGQPEAGILEDALRGAARKPTHRIDTPTHTVEAYDPDYRAPQRDIPETEPGTGAPRAQGVKCAECGGPVYHEAGHYYHCPHCNDYVRVVPVAGHIERMAAPMKPALKKLLAMTPEQVADAAVTVFSVVYNANPADRAFLDERREMFVGRLVAKLMGIREKALMIAQAQAADSTVVDRTIADTTVVESRRSPPRRLSPVSPVRSPVKGTLGHAEATALLKRLWPQYVASRSAKVA